MRTPQRCCPFGPLPLHHLHAHTCTHSRVSCFFVLVLFLNTNQPFLRMLSEVHTNLRLSSTCTVRLTTSQLLQPQSRHHRQTIYSPSTVVCAIPSADESPNESSSLLVRVAGIAFMRNEEEKLGSDRCKQHKTKNSVAETTHNHGQIREFEQQHSHLVGLGCARAATIRMEKRSQPSGCAAHQSQHHHLVLLLVRLLFWLISRVGVVCADTWRELGVSKAAIVTIPLFPTLKQRRRSCVRFAEVCRCNFGLLAKQPTC